MIKLSDKQTTYINEHFPKQEFLHSQAVVNTNACLEWVNDRLENVKRIRPLSTNERKNKNGEIKKLRKISKLLEVV